MSDTCFQSITRREGRLAHGDTRPNNLFGAALAAFATGAAAEFVDHDQVLASRAEWHQD